jgi:predicted metal-dependent peptidase|tara:strand:- start:28189 stop:29514 length:1326 start_codon:yes stop_codon:yes gene_type:complete
MANAQTSGTSVDLPVASDATAEQISNFNLDHHLVNLLLHEPFFSHVLRNVSKTKTSTIPTAGVTVRDGTFQLFWNPSFVAKLATLEVRGLLKHECYHLIFKHCTGRKQDPHMLWNWATDLAINSLIPESELPEGGLRPGKPLDLSKIEDPKLLEKWQKVSELIESLEPCMASEKYMEILKQNKEVSDTIENGSDDGKGGDGQPGQGGTPGPADDHDGWGDLSDEDRQVADAKIRQAVGEAVRRCDRTGQWGSVSGSTREVLRSLVNNSVDWKKVLHNFCGRSQRANRSRTLKKINRKYPYIHPGTRRGHSASVVIYIDQSGSVGSDEIEMFFGALNQLGRITSFSVFNFDTTVDEKSEIRWRRGQKNPPTRTRYGGTSFHAVEKHIREKGAGFDGHIILTDGEAANPGPSVKRRCWVLLPGSRLLFDPSPGDIVVQMESIR